jgi:NAD(P)-dependent dehydrogenase (short-subunit alcohol dehydrogenase family)
MTGPRKPWHLAGKTCLVTGSTSGIGRATAAELANRGARVLAVARDPVRGQATVDEILAASPGAAVEVLTCDLSLMHEVRALARRVIDGYGALDVLINNAGVAKFSRQVTSEGLETTFAVNHLAPFLLTNLLRPALGVPDESRIITVTSEWHVRIRSIPWDDLQRERGFHPTEVYESTKVMNIWFTRVLAERLAGSGVVAGCVAPGFLRTNLTREARGGFRAFLTLVRPFQKGPAAGAEQVMRLAASEEMPGPSGGYFRNGRLAEPSALARDDESARRLWTISAQLCDLAQT